MIIFGERFQSECEQLKMDKSAPQGVAGAPNEAALLALMERTNYSMIQQNGQRKYGGPPPGWEGPPPVRGCEIFIGKIPRDCYEDELVPVFEKIGKIYEFRLMMDFSGSNRGYAFCMYTNKQDASRAIKELNNFEIRKGRLLGVCSSVDNCRLFVGGIPKAKQREEILAEMHKVTDGVVDVIVYPSAVDKTKNRGFAFVEYDCHRAAAMARRKLIPGRIQLWGHQIAVDWAEPEQDVDDDTMSTVRILYVRNLMLSTSEETIKDVFEKAVGKEDCIERVKKLRDYAFVHFKTRDDALKAMETLDGSVLEGSTLEVVLAKPVDKNDFSRVLRGNKTAASEQIYGYQYETPFTTSAFYSQYMSPGIRSVQRGAIGIRGIIRGRGRGAAGSRGAGGTRGYTTTAFALRDGYKKHPVEGRLYDILPGMELTPINPVTLKPQTLKSAMQLLDEMCQKNAWGNPIYQLHSAVHREGAGDMQLFLFKVTIPALVSQNPNPFHPNKLCRTVEEAKSYAAEYVLAQLGLPVESAEIAATPTSPYQGRPIYPNGAQTFTAPALPIVTSASYVVTPGKVVQNPEYPGAYEYQTGYPTSQPPPVYGHQY